MMKQNMNFIENIPEKEYEKFVEKHPTKSHFMQSYYFGEISKEKGFTPHYVGMKQNGKLIATALLLEKKIFKGLKYFYSPRGFVLDYDNLELLTLFSTEIRNYAKKHKIFFVAVDPDVQLQHIDIEGNTIDDGFNNYNLVRHFKKIGFKHLGFNKNFENREPRYTFRLNLQDSMEIIHKNMHATTRKILNKGNQHGLDIFVGNDDNMKDFYFTMEETAIREEINQFPFEYYCKFYNTFNKVGKSDLYVGKVNINKLKKVYKNKITKIENDLEQIKNLKNKNKIDNMTNEYNNQLKKLNDDYNKIKEINNNELILSSIITVKYGNKIWTVHGGNCNQLRELNANYLVYDKIIIDAKNNGYDIIDFFGTTGEDSETNKIHGIHLFKKRLGGNYTEFIGEFHLIINPIKYYMYHILVPIYRKLKK